MNTAVSLHATPLASAGDELLRTVAHEIRQPLCAIASIAYYLAMISPPDASTQEQLTQIQQLVDKANWILANGLRLGDSAAGTTSAVDLNELITEALPARPPLEAPPILDLRDPSALAHLDSAQAGALFGNLIALISGLATPAYPATIRTST